MTEKAKPPKVGANTGNAGKGRPKGSANKTTTEVKEMILEALSGVGGVDYLIGQAKENPKAFLALVGRVMPLQLNGAGPNGEHLVSGITVTLVAPKK